MNGLADCRWTYFGAGVDAMRSRRTLVRQLEA